MSSPFQKIVVGALLFISICSLAVLGYVAAGWRLDDSIYMVVITIFGVGYGEVQPVTSPFLRSLTILVIVSGYAALIYTAGGFMQMLIDGELNKALGARRMNMEIDRLSGHTIICGVGRLGSTLAAELKDANQPFVIVDNDGDRLEDASEKGFLVVNGDATEEDVLKQAGIERASTLATVLSQDAANVFVTITARSMNPGIVIVARGEHPRTERKLLGCGADKVVLPTAIGAKKVAQLITRPSAEKMIEQIAKDGVITDELNRIGLQFDELQVLEGSPLVDMPISRIEIRSNHGFLIIGVRHFDGTLEMNPDIDTKLNAGDVVILLGRNDDIPELEQKFQPQQGSQTYRGVRM